MNNKYRREVLSEIIKIKHKKLLNYFLVDLLTPKEYEEIVKRWQIVKQLSVGIPQRQIAKNLKLSLAKITRGSRVLLNKKGGFNRIFRKKK